LSEESISYPNLAELLYAYKFLTELWEMVHSLRELPETVFMLGGLSLIDITMVANLLAMVVIHLTFQGSPVLLA
jgi:uncharacterized protein (TIGR00645 family)